MIFFKNNNISEASLWKNIESCIEENIEHVKDINSTDEYHTIFKSLYTFYSILEFIKNDKTLLLCLSNEGKTLVDELYLAILESQRLIIANYKEFALDMCCYMEELCDSFILHLDNQSTISQIQKLVENTIDIIESIK